MDFMVESIMLKVSFAVVFLGAFKVVSAMLLLCIERAKFVVVINKQIRIKNIFTENDCNFKTIFV